MSSFFFFKCSSAPLISLCRFNQSYKAPNWTAPPHLHEYMNSNFPHNRFYKNTPHGIIVSLETAFKSLISFFPHRGGKDDTESSPEWRNNEADVSRCRGLSPPASLPPKGHRSSAETAKSRELSVGAWADMCVRDGGGGGNREDTGRESTAYLMLTGQFLAAGADGSVWPLDSSRPSSRWHTHTNNQWHMHKHKHLHIHKRRPVTILSVCFLTVSVISSSLCTICPFVTSPISIAHTFRLFTPLTYEKGLRPSAASSLVGWWHTTSGHAAHGRSNTLLTTQRVSDPSQHIAKKVPCDRCVCLHDFPVSANRRSDGIDLLLDKSRETNTQEICIIITFVIIWDAVLVSFYLFVSRCIHHLVHLFHPNDPKCCLSTINIYLAN